MLPLPELNWIEIWPVLLWCWFRLYLDCRMTCTVSIHRQESAYLDSVFRSSVNFDAWMGLTWNDPSCFMGLTPQQCTLPRRSAKGAWQPKTLITWCTDDRHPLFWVHQKQPYTCSFAAWPNEPLTLAAHHMLHAPSIYLSQNYTNEILCRWLNPKKKQNSTSKQLNDLNKNSGCESQ